MRLLGLLPAALAFLELTRPGGLTFTHQNSPTAQKYLPETMGGGVALLDYDGDGRLDIFLVNGGKLTGHSKSPTGFARRDPLYWNRLYRQNPDGSFTDVTEPAGLSRAADAYGMGVAVGDYDNDGYPDIYVTNYGRNTLYRNTGKGAFQDVTDQAGIGAGGWSVSAGFLDYDKDGRLDLFVSRYLNYDFAHNVLCGTPFRSYCRPDKYEGSANLLYHNEGDGRFADASVPSGIAKLIGKGMGVAFNDYDGDGYPDIFVANDLTEQFLFHNQRNGTFEERALDVGAAMSDDGKLYSGMGVVFADYDNDGRPDILVTNLALEKWALYRNEGGYFAYASLSSGLAGLTVRNSGWGLGLQDFDNDGWKDVFAAQGHVLDNVERIQPTLQYKEPPGLYRNHHGKFERAGLGVGWPAVAGRGAAFGDLNNDGSVDAVIAVLGGGPLVFQGRPNRNHWLTLELKGAGSPRDGQGASVRIGPQLVYATTSGSYLSAGDPRIHFGLGDATKVKVEIAWPSGKVQLLENVAVDQILAVAEPR